MWEMVLWLWMIQCQFMVEMKQALTESDEQSKVWRVRALSIAKTIYKDRKIDIGLFVEKLRFKKSQQGSEYEDESFNQ